MFLTSSSSESLGDKWADGMAIGSEQIPGWLAGSEGKKVKKSQRLFATQPGPFPKKVGNTRVWKPPRLASLNFWRGSWDSTSRMGGLQTRVAHGPPELDAIVGIDSYSLCVRHVGGEKLLGLQRRIPSRPLAMSCTSKDSPKGGCTDSCRTLWEGHTVAGTRTKAQEGPKDWDPVDHLQGSLGPSGPETPTKSEKSLPGLRPRGPPRESGKSLEKVFRDLFETFSRLSRLFRDFFPDSPAPGDFFQTFSGSLGPGGPERPL